MKKPDGNRWLCLVFICLFLVASCQSEQDAYTSTREEKPIKVKSAWEEEYQNAKVASFSGDNASAESKFAKLLKILQNKPDKKLVVAEIKARLAKIYIKQGHVKAAIPLIEQALETVKQVKIDSAENSELLVLMDDLADMLNTVADGSGESYTDYLKLAARLQTVSHSGIHSRSLNLQVKLANYYIARDKDEEAKPHLNEALRLLADKDLPKPEGALTVLLSTYRLLKEKGHKQEADSVHEAVYQKLDSLSKETANAQLNQLLGQTYSSAKDKDIALKYYRKSLEEQKSFSNPTMEANTITHIAFLEEESGNIKEADKLMAKAVDVQRKSPGSLSKYLVKRLDQYSSFLLRYGQRNKAKVLEKEANEYRAKYIQF